MEIQLKHFRLNQEGGFSITKPHESQQILNHIERYIQLTDVIITDGTACMGGDLIKFSKKAKIVNGVEIESENFKLLIENCKIFNCPNVNLFCQDYTEIYEQLKQDIIYLDPQWGGPMYKEKETISLKMGKMELWELILDIKTKKLAKFIFIKVPLNVCLDNIQYDCVNTIYNKSRIPSFKLICICVV